MADKFELKAIISASAEPLLRTLKVMQPQLKQARKYIGDVGGALNGLSGKVGLPLAGLSTLTAGFSGVAIKNAIVQFTDLSESLMKSSYASGIQVEQLQKLKYVGEQSGVEIESLQHGVGKLNKNIGEAAGGKNKDLAALFKKLHVNLRDSNGQLKGAADLLPEISDAFIRNKNPVVQATMGTALFGRQWQEMIPLLMEGSAGIDSSLDRFKRLKSVMSESDLRAGKELGDQLKDLEFLTKGFQMTIAKELVPELRPLIEEVIQWGAANRKLVASKVKEYVHDFAVFIKSIDWTGIINGTKEMANSAGVLIDKVGGTKNALIGLAVFMNLPLISSFIGVIGSVGRLSIWLGGLIFKIPLVAAAFSGLGTTLLGLASGALGFLRGAILTVGRLFLTNPIGLAITGIALGAFLIYENWDKLKIWFSDFFNWIGDKWRGLLDSVSQFAGIVKQFFGFGGEGGIKLPGVAQPGGAPFSAQGGDVVAGLNPSLNAQPKPLFMTQQNKVQGSINVKFDNAPQGMRVESDSKGSAVPMRTDVGYRGYATGLGF